MKTPDPPSGCGEKRPSPTRRRAPLFAAALLLLLIVGVTTKLVFAPWQEIAPVVPLPEDFLLQHKLTGEFMKALSSDAPPEAMLKLSAAEINSLFRIAANFKIGKLPRPLRYYPLSCGRDGIFSLRIPLRTGATWLWGGTIYLHAEFKLKKNEAGPEIKLLSLRAGKVPVGTAIAQRQLDRRLEVLKRDSGYRFFNMTVRSISFDGENMLIVYRPGLLKFLPSQIK